MEKPPIKMPQMVKFIEELVELATSTNHVLRYKCLKPQEMENGKAKVSPRLLQLSLREERLHGLLMTLTNSSVWVLIQTRIRQHQMKENMLANASSSLFRQRA